MPLKQSKKAIAARARYAAKKAGTYVPKRQASARQSHNLEQGRLKRAHNLAEKKRLIAYYASIGDIRGRPLPRLPRKKRASAPRAINFGPLPALPLIKRAMPAHLIGRALPALPRMKRVPTQKQLDALARGRAKRALSLVPRGVYAHSRALPALP